MSGQEVEVMIMSASAYVAAVPHTELRAPAAPASSACLRSTVGDSQRMEPPLAEQTAGRAVRASSPAPIRSTFLFCRC